MGAVGIHSDSIMTVVIIKAVVVCFTTLQTLFQQHANKRKQGATSKTLHWSFGPDICYCRGCSFSTHCILVDFCGGRVACANVHKLARRNHGYSHDNNGPRVFEKIELDHLL